MRHDHSTEIAEETALCRACSDDQDVNVAVPVYAEPNGAGFESLPEDTGYSKLVGSA